MPKSLRHTMNMLIVGVFITLVVMPWDMWLGSRVDLAHSLAGMSAAHPLGTDNIGRDLLVRGASALRGAVLPLWLGVILGSVVGLGVALLAILVVEARRARTAVALLDVTAALLASIPVGLVAFAWAVWQDHAGLLPVLLSLGGLFAVRTYLETRDLFRHDAGLGFWTAHAALGGSLFYRLWRYGVLAGWKWTLLRTLCFHLRAAVAIEASLSYLGFGIQEPQASFGNMLASHFDLYLKGRFEILVIMSALLALTAALPGAAADLLQWTLSPKIPDKKTEFLQCRSTSASCASR